MTRHTIRQYGIGDYVARPPSSVVQDALADATRRHIISLGLVPLDEDPTFYVQTHLAPTGQDPSANNSRPWPPAAEVPDGWTRWWVAVAYLKAYDPNEEQPQ